MPDLVFRNPPWRAGYEIYMAHEIQDKIDWGQQVLQIPEIWKYSKGAGIRVAILDTGRPTHRDLQGAITKPKNCTNSPSDIDMQGHSTHVHGTVGSRENGFGVVGGAPECEMVPIKVLNDNGEGIGQWIAAGIEYAMSVNADIISMSLGGGADPVIMAAVQRAVAAGIFVICAAGNEGKDPSGRSRVGSPGNMDEVVSVAAFGQNGEITDFSSEGDEVDVGFPGDQILSTWPGDTYRRLSGTSMATPCCSSVVACRLGYQRALERAGKTVSEPMRNNADLLRLIQKYSIDKGAVGHDAAWGWGQLDVVRFVASASPVVATPSPTPVTPPTAPVTPPNGGSPISEQRITLLGKKLRIVEPVVYDGHTGSFLYQE